MLSSVEKGNAAVLFTQYKLSEVGLTILSPLCEDLPFDLVIYHNRTFYRVQVKRAMVDRRLPDRYFIPVRKITCNSKRAKVYVYTEEHTDFIIGVVPSTEDLYCFPIGDVINYTIGLTVDPLQIANQKFGEVNRKINPEEYRNKIKLGDDIIVLK
jgi:hypothetical protein